jgi:hypothetical protein
MSLADLLISPDGTKIMILAQRSAKVTPGERSPLWVVNADGTGLENLPGDPALLGAKIEMRAYVYLVAWVQAGGGVLIAQRFPAPANTYRLWVYDLKNQTARLLLDNALQASWFSPVSPRGERLAIKYQKTAGKPWVLALLDLKTLGTTDITGGDERVWSGASWDKTGDQLAYLIRRAQPGGPGAYALAVYSLTAGKTVSERTMTTKESDALLLWPAWTADGAKLLVLDRTGNRLKVLRPDLSEEKTIAFPAPVRLPAGLQTAGDHVLIEDGETDTLWRLDLRTGSWKKIL